jgi:hypothetical protein
MGKGDYQGVNSLSSSHYQGDSQLLKKGLGNAIVDFIPFHFQQTKAVLKELRGSKVLARGFCIT